MNISSGICPGKKKPGQRNYQQDVATRFKQDALCMTMAGFSILAVARALHRKTKLGLTLTHFWGVGEEKPATLYEGESPSKTATTFYQGITSSF